MHPCRRPQASATAVCLRSERYQDSFVIFMAGWLVPLDLGQRITERRYKLAGWAGAIRMPNMGTDWT